MRGSMDGRQRRSGALAGDIWKEFEGLLADYFHRRGYEVERVGAAGTSGRTFHGGVDLKLRREGRYVVVQFKASTGKAVAHDAVHELLGIMVAESAHGAILVTSGEFTPYAVESAQKIGSIELLDGIELRRRLELPVPSPSWVERGSGTGSRADELLAAAADQADGEWRRRDGRKRSRPPSDHRVALQVVVLGVLVVVFLVVWKVLF